MRFGVGRGMVYVALMSTIVLYDCGFLGTKEERGMQQKLNRSVEESVEMFSEYTASSLRVYELMQGGKCEEAKATLERELKDQATAATIGIGFLPGLTHISGDSKRKIHRILSQQLEDLSRAGIIKEK